jgi:hypothetical protein
MRDQLKIPSDIEDADEEYGLEKEGSSDEDDDDENEGGAFDKFNDDDERVDEVFALAKENNEMRNTINHGKQDAGEAAQLSTAKITNYANQELLPRIDKIEQQMLENDSRQLKPWQL